MSCTEVEAVRDEVALQLRLPTDFNLPRQLRKPHSTVETYTTHYFFCQSRMRYGVYFELICSATDADQTFRYYGLLGLCTEDASGVQSEDSRF